jgi:cytochrome c oxidase subunit IV
MNNKLGYALIIMGFILLVLNAIDYIGGFFGLSLEIRTSMIIGLFLVVIGMVVAKKKNG